MNLYNTKDTTFTFTIIITLQSNSVMACNVYMQSTWSRNLVAVDSMKAVPFFQALSVSDVLPCLAFSIFMVCQE